MTKEKRAAVAQRVRAPDCGSGDTGSNPGGCTTELGKKLWAIRQKIALERHGMGRALGKRVGLQNRQPAGFDSSATC